MHAASVELEGGAQLVLTVLQWNTEDDMPPLGHLVHDARHFFR